MKVLAVIPARGGSKDIKNKNLLKIEKKSLVSIAISKAKKSKYISKIALTSDDEKILKEGKKSNLEYCIKRPNKYATDKASIFKTIKHTVEWFDKNHNWCPDIIAIILPTTPLRPLWHIETCLKKMIDKNLESVMTIKKPEYPPYWMLKRSVKGKMRNLVKNGNKFLRRQETPLVYQPAGTMWAFKIKILDQLIKSNKILPTKKTIGIIVPQDESINIDEYRHYTLAKSLFKKSANI